MRNSLPAALFIIGLAITVAWCFREPIWVHYETLKYLPTWRKVVASGNIECMAEQSTIILYEPPYRLQVPEWWIPDNVRESVLDARERMVMEERMDQDEHRKRKRFSSVADLRTKEEILRELFPKGYK